MPVSFEAGSGKARLIGSTGSDPSNAGRLCSPPDKPLGPPRDSAQVSLGQVRAPRGIAEEIVKDGHDGLAYSAASGMRDCNSKVQPSLGARFVSGGTWTADLAFPFCAPSPPTIPTSPDRLSTASAIVAAASFAQVMFAMSDNRPSGDLTRHMPGYFSSGTTRANSVPQWRTAQATPC